MIDLLLALLLALLVLLSAATIWGGLLMLVEEKVRYSTFAFLGLLMPKVGEWSVGDEIKVPNRCASGEFVGVRGNTILLQHWTNDIRAYKYGKWCGNYFVNEAIEKRKEQKKQQELQEYAKAYKEATDAVC